VEAIRILFNGGGGQITPKSLLLTISEEFAFNKDVQALLSRLS
jgi:hypothetical protein